MRIWLWWGLVFYALTAAILGDGLMKVSGVCAAVSAWALSYAWEDAL